MLAWFRPRGWLLQLIQLMAVGFGSHWLPAISCPTDLRLVEPAVLIQSIWFLKWLGRFLTNSIQTTSTQRFTSSLIFTFESFGKFWNKIFTDFVLICDRICSTNISDIEVLRFLKSRSVLPASYSSTTAVGIFCLVFHLSKLLSGIEDSGCKKKISP